MSLVRSLENSCLYFLSQVKVRVNCQLFGNSLEYLSRVGKFEIGT